MAHKPKQFDLAAIDSLLQVSKSTHLDTKDNYTYHSPYSQDYHIHDSPQTNPIFTASPKKFENNDSELQYFQVTTFLMAAEIERLNNIIENDVQDDSLKNAIEHWRMKFNLKAQEVDDLRKEVLNQNEVLHQLDLIHSENVQLKNENNYLTKRIEGLIDDNKHLMDDESNGKYYKNQLDKKAKELKNEQAHSNSLQTIIDKLKGQVKYLEDDLKKQSLSYDQLQYEYNTLKQRSPKHDQVVRPIVKLPTRELDQVRKQLEDLNYRYNQLYQEYQLYKQQKPETKEIIIQKDNQNDQIRSLQDQLELLMKENNQLKQRQQRSQVHSNAWCC